MNRLPVATRNRIVELRLKGWTIREVAAELGVSRDAVLRYCPKEWQRKAIRLSRALEEALRAEDFDPIEFMPFLDLDSFLSFTCPLHPDAELEDPGDCPDCLAEGMRRHHERRAARGLPRIVPPWRRAK